MKWYWLFFVLLVIFIPNLFISHEYMQESLMPDLHIRITGTRWMDAGMSPYFSQWKPGDDYRMYNPNLFIASGVNAVTATPTILRLQQSLARMNYCDIKFTWWVVMEVMLFATLFLTCLVPVKLLRQLLTVGVGAAFFCYSRNWWLHVYNGQYYVVFAFAFAFIAFFVVRVKKRFTPLFLMPLTSLLRPFFAVAIIPWLLNLHRKKRLAIVAASMLSLGLMVASAPVKTWLDYSKAMRIYNTEITAEKGQVMATDHRMAGLPVENCIEVQPGFKVFNAGSMFSLQHYLNEMNIKLSNPTLYTGFLLVAIVLFLLITKPAIINAGNENLLLSSFFLYILAELFTPAIRSPYNMVQYLGILGVFMNKADGKLMLLLLLGLLLNHDFPFRFKYQREIGEGLMLVAIYLALFVRNKKMNMAVR
jgi:hypothetical protein